MLKAPRLVIIIAILAIFPLALASAQEIETIAPEALAGSFSIVAEDGSFVANEDGTFTLSISAADDLNWFTMTPALDAGRYETLAFASDWAAAPAETVVEAALALEDATLILSLSQPDFFEGTLSFNAEVVEIITAEVVKGGAVAPEFFTEGVLSIVMDASFVDALQFGMDARLDDIRPFNVQSCNPVLRSC